MENCKEKAARAFLSGANCAQAVLAAYAERFGLDERTAMNIASGFGGGMGGQRKTCGALSAAYMVIGLSSGYDPGDNESKKKLYAKIREFSKDFEDEFGATDCAKLLELSSIKAQTEPAVRNNEYYKQRPCARFVEYAAEKLCEYI